MANQQSRQATAPGRIRDKEGDASAKPREQQGSLERPDTRRRLYGRGKDLTPQLTQRDGGAERLATGLGWFSIGLGLAEILAPKGLSRLIGLEKNHPILLRVLGAREIMAGIGILSERRPAGWVWSRVAGDAMDLSLLLAAYMNPDSNKARVTLATASVLGVTALDIYDAQKLGARPGAHGGLSYVETCTIMRPPEEVYGFWRDFRNLPRFMNHLESVDVIDERRSHWVAKGPLGATVEWDAEITDDTANESISWRSLEGSEVDNYGTVRFTRAPGDRGTEVRVEIEYNPPGGALGAGIAKIFGEAPEQQVKDDLSRFKQVLEIGEVVKSDASIYSGPHPAQPPEGNVE
ncbi:MAG TPA: SRPBCC family protein [Blastocatellia bacterium]|nr:SRPBCC family protein [Blastocatellia bacterium]